LGESDALLYKSKLNLKPPFGGFFGVIDIKAFRITAALFLVLWMILIFTFSSQNAEVSSETSGSVVQKLCEVFYPDFKEAPAEEQTDIISSFQFIARKSAHFSIYTVLGILSALTFISYKGIRFYLRFAISAAVCLLYAVSDEIHQYFVPGRSCELRDVCIDFSGAVIGVIAVALCARYIKRLYARLV